MPCKPCKAEVDGATPSQPASRGMVSAAATPSQLPSPPAGQPNSPASRLAPASPARKPSPSTRLTRARSGPTTTSGVTGIADCSSSGRRRSGSSERYVSPRTASCKFQRHTTVHMQCDQTFQADAPSCSASGKGKARRRPLRPDAAQHQGQNGTGLLAEGLPSNRPCASQTV